MSVPAKGAAIVRMDTAWGPVWQVRRYPEVKQVLGDDRFEQIRPTSAVNVWLAEGRFEEAGRIRDEGGTVDSGTGELDNATRALRLRLMNAVASPHNVRRRTPEIQALATDLSRTFAASRTPVNASVAYSAPLCARAMCVLLGVAARESAEFVSYAGSATSAAGIATIAPRVRELVGRRQADPRPDVMSELLAGGGDRRQVAGLTNVLTWLLMGSNWEVPAAIIDFGLSLLFANPQQRRRLAADPALLPTTVEETSRLFVASEVARGGLVRRATSDLAVGGVQLPAGAIVLADVAAANRDERVFADPEAFDVGRQPNPHLTFGYGPYMCKFIPMSRVLIGTGIGTALGTLPGMRSAAGPSGQPRQRGGEFDDLWVAW
jgi:cytochrome P450